MQAQLIIIVQNSKVKYKIITTLSRKHSSSTQKYWTACTNIHVQELILLNIPTNTTDVGHNGRASFVLVAGQAQHFLLQESK